MNPPSARYDLDECTRRAPINGQYGFRGGAPRGQRQTTILFIDPRPLTRECLSRELEIHAGDLRVLPIANPAEIPAGAESLGPVDLVLLNIAWADVSDPRVDDILKTIQLHLPATPIVVLSDREESEAIAAAVCRGVRGYLLTSFDLGLLIEALRFVRAGGTCAPVEVVVDALRDRRAARESSARGGLSGRGPGGLAGFTPRQLQVLDLLRHGKSNKIIAYQLAMQESTVKVHVRDIMKKLKATNRTQAALRAQQLFEARDRAAAGANEPEAGARSNGRARPTEGEDRSGSEVRR